LTVFIKYGNIEFEKRVGGVWLAVERGIGIAVGADLAGDAQRVHGSRVTLPIRSGKAPGVDY
jgi:hypothetical protein